MTLTKKKLAAALTVIGAFAGLAMNLGGTKQQKPSTPVQPVTKNEQTVTIAIPPPPVAIPAKKKPATTKKAASPIFQEVKAVVETKTGYEAFAYFSKNGTGEVLKVPLTENEYKALGLRGAVNPSVAGYTFKSAGGRELFSISKKVLNDYEYYRDGTDVSSSTLARVKFPGEDERTVLLTAIPK